MWRFSGSLPYAARRYLRLIVKCGLGILAAVLLSHWLSHHHTVEHFAASRLANGMHVDKLANGQVRLTVPPNKIPQSETDRLTAPISSLLPSHWESDPQTRLSTGDAVPVSLADRGQILTTAVHFLSHWETFRPWSKATYNRWRRGIEPFLAAIGADSIVSRTDSYQPETICPQPSCPTGSTWVGPDPSTIEIRAYDQAAGTAYLTLNGTVVYKSSFGGGRPEHYERQYGLLLDKNTGSWKVSRAAADTVSH